MLYANPYPMYRRLRDEVPLYYNAAYDFYALSRFTDVSKALAGHDTFSSARGGILEYIKAELPVPPGMLIFEDPPIHDIHRSLRQDVHTAEDQRARAQDPRVLRAEP